MKFKTAWKMKAQTQVLNLWGLLLVILWLNKECTLSWIMISIHIKEGYPWIVIHIKVAFFLKITIHIKVGFFKVIIHIKVDFFKIMIHIKEGSSWNMINIQTQKFATYWADTLLQTPTKHPKTHQQDNSGPRKGLGGSIAPSHWVYHCPDQEERHWGKRHKCTLDYKT